MAEIQSGQTGKDPSKQGLTLWLWDGGGDGRVILVTEKFWEDTTSGGQGSKCRTWASLGRGHLSWDYKAGEVGSRTEWSRQRAP